MLCPPRLQQSLTHRGVQEMFVGLRKEEEVRAVSRKPKEQRAWWHHMLLKLGGSG